MLYTRVEIRFRPRGIARTVLLPGPVGGSAHAVMLDPGMRTVVMTRSSRARKRLADTPAPHAPVASSSAPPAGPGVALIAMSARTRLVAHDMVVGRLRGMWCDRLTGAATHLLVRASDDPRGQRYERIVPFEMIEQVGKDRCLLRKDVPSLRQLPVYRPDEDVLRAVRLALASRFADPQTRRAIKIHVDDGLVILSGSVDTSDIIAVAAQVVRRVPGVRGLSVDLVAHDTLADRVLDSVNRLIVEQHFTDTSVRVLTEHAIVYLEGYAPTAAIRNAIEQAALATSGARVVVNDIAIDHMPPSATGTGPLVRNR